MRIFTGVILEGYNKDFKRCSTFVVTTVLFVLKAIPVLMHENHSLWPSALAKENLKYLCFLGGLWTH